MRARARVCLIHVPVLTRAHAACVSQRIDDFVDVPTTSEVDGIVGIVGAVAAASSASGGVASEARCAS